MVNQLKKAVFTIKEQAFAREMSTGFLIGFWLFAMVLFATAIFIGTLTVTEV